MKSLMPVDITYMVVVGQYRTGRRYLDRTRGSWEGQEPRLGGSVVLSDY